MAVENYRCAHCCADFQSNQPRVMYCCKQCKGASWRKANPVRMMELRLAASKQDRLYCNIYAGYCAGCGSAFVAQRKKAYCSDACHYVAKYVSIAPLVRECKGCGKCFEAPKAKTRPSDFCGQTCKNAALKSHKRTGRLKRKAAQRAVQVESVNPFRVFDRDGWRCKLCGVKTPKGKRGTYESNAPELDHIIPLSKGGDHSYLNTQCTCRACNSAKSDKPMGQMLLVG